MINIIKDAMGLRVGVGIPKLKNMFPDSKHPSRAQNNEWRKIKLKQKKP